MTVRAVAIPLCLALALFATPGCSSPPSETMASNVLVDLGGGTRTGDAPGDVLVSVAAAFEPRTGLAQEALSLADPAPGPHAPWLTLRDVAERYGADSGHLRAAVAVLGRAGGHPVTDATATIVHAELNVSQAERLFAASWGIYRLDDGTTAVRPDQMPRLPAELRTATLVFGLSALLSTPDPPALPHAANIAADGSAGTPAEPCIGFLAAGGATPTTLASRYGIDQLVGRGLDGSGQRLAIIGIAGYDDAAIGHYLTCIGRPSATRPVAQRPFAGAVTGSDAEVDLDIELVLAVAPNLERLDVIEIPASGTAGTVFALDAALGAGRSSERPADVIATSVTWCESDIDGRLRTVLDHQLQAAAAAGVTIVAAAGDHGRAGCWPATAAAEAAWPSSSPWVLTVGGTDIGAPDERAWSGPRDEAGGGGESRFEKRPASQPHTKAGRVYPDLAAASSPKPGYSVVYCAESGGSTCRWLGVGGTSAATPVVASAISLVNQQLRQAGERSAGYVNPMLDHASAGMTDDVLAGSIRAFGLDCCDAGPGWDMATGWGVPRFDRWATTLSRR